ncbi:glycosyltransferase family 2 protein [Halobacteriaceae archaeon GCM10025711]
MRLIFRAQRRNHTVLVAYHEASQLVVNTARRLGAEIVHPVRERPDSESLRRRLAAVARRKGFPAVVLHRRIDRRIDFERTESALAESQKFVIEAQVNGRGDGVGDEVLVAIPSYNEERTIASVVDEARAYADSVLVVDDGSTDRTAERAENAGAFVVEHENNRGYGAALKTVFREANQRNVDHVVVIDGDGQHDPADIPNLVSVQREQNAHVVIGSRFDDGAGCRMPLYRRTGLEIINRLTAMCLNLLDAEFDVRDTQSGFRVYDARAVETLADDDTISDGMSASLDILFHALRHGYSVTEVGTTIEYENGQTSTHNPLHHGYSLVRTILRTIEHERPITTLGVPGFLSTLVGFGFGYWTLTNYVHSGSFPVGIAVTAAIFLLPGFLACFTAIILHSLKTYFDVRPNAVHGAGRNY